MAMIDTVIFDGEGVVLDTEGIWDRGQEEFLRRRGVAYDRERIKPLLTGRSLAEGVRVLREEYGFDGNDEKLAVERLEIVRPLFERDIKFVDGFLEFFENTRSRYKTCIATALDVDLLRLADRRLQLSALFDSRIFSLEDVNYRSKPNPDLFLHAARALGSTPRSCVVIEDSPYGVEAARRAGMKCIGLASTYDRSKLTGADLVVDAFSEIDLESLKSWGPARIAQAKSL